jgi:hypothetical protein
MFNFSFCYICCRWLYCLFVSCSSVIYCCFCVVLLCSVLCCGVFLLCLCFVTPLSTKFGTKFRRQVAVAQSVYFVRRLRATEFVCLGVCLFVCLCVMCFTCLLYCCTTTTGLKPNCSLTNIYIYIYIYSPRRLNSKNFGLLLPHLTTGNFHMIFIM